MLYGLHTILYTHLQSFIHVLRYFIFIYLNSLEEDFRSFAAQRRVTIKLANTCNYVEEPAIHKKPRNIDIKILKSCFQFSKSHVDYLNADVQTSLMFS